MRLLVSCVFFLLSVSLISAVPYHIPTGKSYPVGTYPLPKTNPENPYQNLPPTQEQINASATVRIDTGEIRGYVDDNVNIFRGIPYAAPPTGQNRFRPPQPAESWSGIRETILNGPICPQLNLANLVHLGKEDCLYLDVYIPEGIPLTSKLPVLVWIYGGGWFFGDNWEFGLYDATKLVKQHGYIFVAMNYRLGALGFLATDELRAENGDGSAGNMGLRDQRAAFQWIQRNIANFGGDPNRVTIFGESAGAFSVCYHLASPASFGLFQGGLMESGTCDSNNFFFSYNDSKDWSLTYSQMVGCNHTQLSGDAFLECLRGLSTPEIMGPAILPMNFPSYGNFHPGVYPIMPWGATMDMSDAGLYQLPIDAIRDGDWAKVPIVAGTNNDEGTIFIPMMFIIVPGTHLPIDDADLNIVLLHFFAANQTLVNTIYEHYPEYAYKSPADRGAKILRDFFFACSMRRATWAMSAQGSPAFLYHLTYQGDWIDYKLFSDYHSFDLQFVFDNEFPPVIHKYSERDQTLANTFGDFWSNFAWTGNPNGNEYHKENRGNNPVWPFSNSTTMENLVMDVPAAVEEEYVAAQCEFWNTVETLNPWGRERPKRRNRGERQSAAQF